MKISPGWLKQNIFYKSNFFFKFTQAVTPHLLRFGFYMIHSQISWPRSGDCGGAGFEPGTAASSKMPRKNLNKLFVYTYDFKNINLP
jgi:hypothetical protein